MNAIEIVQERIKELKEIQELKEILGLTPIAKSFQSRLIEAQNILELLKGKLKP